MANRKLRALHHQAKNISEHPSIREKMASLNEAFALFSKETKRLETAYSDLKNQFARTHKELEEANKQLNNKVLELDLVTSYLNSILLHISQGMLFINSPGMIITYNPSAEKILETPAQHVLFSHFWDHFDDGIFGFSLKEALAANKAPEQITVPFTPKGSYPKDLEVSTSFIHQSNKQTQGLIVLIRDITKLRKLQILAARNDRMKELGEMAAAVAHEIRNPLGGIAGFASLLSRDLQNQPQMREMAQAIIDGAQTLNRFVSDVLNYARPLHLELSLININTLVDEVLALVQADSAFPKNISYQCVFPKDEHLATIDRELIKSALLNLIVNALQAMPQGGDLTIALSEQDFHTFISVSDSGTGISKENLEKIFSPFFTTKPQGTGVGLSETYKIAQAHGGTVEVISKEGSGTTFTLKLPLRQ